ncbi:hypothetical protein FDP41_012558 [Naegleria fowleri]|uniref:leishmanolysin n=1 Tax=Naegleria fowleri TaxID=5763 RepID=A0A6A5C651_NAEFO|nr:uncharacterized protein FDP41_012558 [Naegleria fowleri]KAF0981298.1 hypothetical protein FDP41_012558 [Naegleria fowleri]
MRALHGNKAMDGLTRRRTTRLSTERGRDIPSSRDGCSSRNLMRYTIMIVIIMSAVFYDHTNNQHYQQHHRYGGVMAHEIFTRDGPTPHQFHHQSASNTHEPEVGSKVINEQEPYHKCIHDDILQYERSIRHLPGSIFYQMEASFLHQEQELKKRKRSISTSQEVWSNLRIVFRLDYLGATDVETRTCIVKDQWYWDGINTPTGQFPGTPACDSNTLTTNCWRKCTDEQVISDALISNIRDVLLPSLKQELSLTVQTRSVRDGDLTSFFSGMSRCGSRGGVPIPSDLKAKGFDGLNADIIIFVTTRPTDKGVLGWAVSCASDAITKRPLAGQLNVSPSILSYSLKERMSVLIHESFHALGFSQAAMNTFYNSTLSRTMSFNEVGVVEVGRSHYNCPTLTGIEMEEGGGQGTAFSHWEKRIMRNEIMVGSLGKEQLILSPFTLAYFEDSGWYKANFSRATRLLWGRDMGCKMASGRCEQWSQDTPTRTGYYCRDSSVSTCSYDLKSKGGCSITTHTQALGYYEHVAGSPRLGGQDDLMDYCPLVEPVTSCSDIGASKVSVSEYFGPDSACFESNIAGLLIGQKDVDTRCFKYACEDGLLVFYIQDRRYTCSATQEYERKESMPIGFKGYVACPKNGYDILCGQQTAKKVPHTSKGPCLFGVFFCNSATNVFENAFMTSLKVMLAFFGAFMLLLE